MAPPPDDGSGNRNQLVPLLRRLIRNYGVCVIIASAVLMGALIAEIAGKWNARPSWIQKVSRLLASIQPPACFLLPLTRA
jgi:hypothetical protein